MGKNRKDNSYRKLNHYNLIQSFFFALQGIWFSLKWERNLRIHLIVAGYLAYFSLKYYSFTKSEMGLLVLSISFVITSELLNTAIEKTVDIETPDYNPLAKTAKDVAAGAVLVGSIGSIIIGIILFWDISILSTILSDIIKRFYIWIAVVAVSLLIIFIPEKNGKNSNK